MRISDGSSDVCSSDLPGQVFGSQARLFAEALGRHVVGVAPGRGLADLYQPLVDAALQVDVRQPEGDAELARETALSDMIPRLDDVQHQPGRFGLLIAVRGKGRLRRHDGSAKAGVSQRRGLQIGRASCRERVCQYGENSVVAVR